MATGMALGLALGNGGSWVGTLILLGLIAAVVLLVWGKAKLEDWRYHRWLSQAEASLGAGERRIADLQFGSRKLIWKSVYSKR